MTILAPSMPKILTLLAAITVLYLLGFVLLFVFQRTLIYYPQPSANTSPAHILTLSVADEKIQVSFRPYNGNDAIIYFGGNGEDVSYNLPFFSNLFPRHAVYFLHYRGYGNSTGTPSEQGILQDALTLFDKVHAEHPNITLVGCSLGTGIAVQIANLRPASKLILVTPFDSLQNVAKYRFPVMPIDWMLEDKFESWRYVPQLTLPTLILMAEHDQVIPRANTENLYAHFKRGIATLKVIANTDHGSIYANPQYIPLLKEFVH